MPLTGDVGRGPSLPASILASALLLIDAVAL